jgi:hypothetical protein
MRRALLLGLLALLTALDAQDLLDQGTRESTSITIRFVGNGY